MALYPKPGAANGAQEPGNVPLREASRRTVVTGSVRDVVSDGSAASSSGP